MRWWRRRKSLAAQRIDNAIGQAVADHARDDFTPSPERAKPDNQQATGIPLPGLPSADLPPCAPNPEHQPHEWTGTVCLRCSGNTNAALLHTLPGHICVRLDRPFTGTTRWNIFPTKETTVTTPAHWDDLTTWEAHVLGFAREIASPDNPRTDITLPTGDATSRIIITAEDHLRSRLEAEYQRGLREGRLDNSVVRAEVVGSSEWLRDLADRLQHHLADRHPADADCRLTSPEHIRGCADEVERDEQARAAAAEVDRYITDTAGEIADKAWDAFRAIGLSLPDDGPPTWLADGIESALRTGWDGAQADHGRDDREADR